jgi:hypothetical protein
MGPDQTPGEQQLNPQLMAAVKIFSDWWRARESELDIANQVREPLFHYTDMAGMLGILRTETIWFTSIFHLSDPSELAHTIEIALGILEEEAQAGDRVVQAFCAWMAHVLVKAGGEIFGFYIASFSQTGDDLGQWRTYADDGRGVVLGLSPTLFAVVDKRSVAVNEMTLAAHVIYDQEQCVRRIRDAIRRAVEDNRDRRYSRQVGG